MRKLLSAVLFTASATVATGAAAITWDPGSVGLGAGGPFASFSFDDILVQSYTSVGVTGATFSTQGFVDLTNFRVDQSIVASPNCSFCGPIPKYNLYVAFTGTGSEATGQLTSLTYNLMGASGTTTFTPNASGIFEAVGGSGAKTLGSGTLIAGSVTPDSVRALTLFTPNTAFSSFFVSPTADVLLNVTAAFITTSPGIIAGRSIFDGAGGQVTISAVPEPEMYAMMLSGLGLVAFAARRRRKVSAS